MVAVRVDVDTLVPRACGAGALACLVLAALVAPAPIPALQAAVPSNDNGVTPDNATAPDNDDALPIATVTMAVDVGDMAPDFTLTDVGGGTFNLGSHRGKVVVIDFMDAWVGACYVRTDRLKTVFSGYDSSRLTIVSVCVSSDSEDSIRRFRNVRGAGWAFASGPIVGAEYGVENVPTTFIVDKWGVVAFKNVGVMTAPAISDEIGKRM